MGMEGCKEYKDQKIKVCVKKLYFISLYFAYKSLRNYDFAKLLSMI